MFRLRRYRYYVFFAAIVVFLLYRVAQNSEQWETVSSSFPHAVTPSKSKPPPTSNSGVKDQADTSFKGFSSDDDDLPQKILDNTGNDNYPATIPDLKIPQKADAHDDDNFDHTPKAPVAVKEGQVLAYDHDEASKATTAPVNVPDKNVGHGAKDVDKSSNVKQTLEPVHWKKVPEHFPVLESDIIPLPAGKPRKIPTIQYAFEKESADFRTIREERQEKVKAEMARGWAGYWKYARGHDELSPITKKFRDPFCGWAATLVDSLDTLWIMGMEDEFKEALLEVEKIDFTISKRSEIPVFETTIRYLGGFIAAYDVSGGKSGGFDILLEKAVELAEILMGVFDTPNRMPVLYYNWKPQFASRPKRAGTGVSVAELGSLAMEFTRLAQITKENKYYDAVARITDGFYEWQERGTSIPGIFPEHIDASGCNRTAQNELEAAQNAAAAKAAEETESDSTQGTGLPADGDDKLGLKSNVYPNSRQGESDKAKSQVFKRSESGTSLDLNKVKKMKNPKTGKVEIVAGESPLPECVSQGLTASGWGGDQYSMGGSQDSTYEYFPKQWLLLGGLEPKYKELHLKVSEAVKKWLLFRPMVPDDRDILFSAKVISHGEPETDATTQYEVTHLTCFIGGMFGMSGKIFEIPADVEIGKKLTDGCVWAYESTLSGIMPEGAHVLPCHDAKNCHWNQTLYDQALDPQYDSRDEQIEDYYRRKEKAKAAAAKEKEEQKLAKEIAEKKLAKEIEEEKLAKEIEEEKLAKESEAKKLAMTETGQDRLAKEREEKKLAKEREAKKLAQGSTSSKSETGQLKKTTLDEKLSNGLENAGSVREGHAPDHDHARLRKRAPVSTMEDPEVDTAERKPVAGKKKVEFSAAGAEDAEDSEPAPGFEKSTISQVPLHEQDRDEEDPLRPLSHKEYVANKIENEKLPKGFVNVFSRSYILRPEAIESVWYMYRITGDKKWQDKGWKMFEAIVRHTATDIGSSAIDNVLTTNTTQLNEMESFWTAETLKYFYLLYSDPSLISLDQWVLNTEAHPFKRPKAPFGV
ncbi:glycoside hydrolase family 47 protein [Xylariaceae sp. AK1471]|nr:glycoside hydrolase family 47 protein [Xylariaceae sp. AK1471]